ncbi:hypothetical protein MMC14_002003 [Varicellaria rhodocarpa]|nr:hypothetical protein [Varicellaria rhodocarpa]
MAPITVIEASLSLTCPPINHMKDPITIAALCLTFVFFAFGPLPGWGFFQPAPTTTTTAAATTITIPPPLDTILIPPQANIINHIVHHVCTIFALGAAPDAIRRHYDRNASYQRPPPPLEDHIVQGLYDPAKFLANLTEPSRYRDYLMFFQKEIAKKGYEDVLNEYVFKSDERANIMFARLYAGGFFSF